MIRRTLPVLVFLMTAAACGPSSTGGPQDGSNGHPIDASIDVGMYDFGCGGNTACPLNKVCCTMPGTPLTFSCVAPGSCPAADKITCDGPDECGGSTPACCGVDVPNGTGTYPQCNPASLSTTCTSVAGCPTHLGSSCTDTTKVQICHVSSECTDPTNNKCCTFMSGGASLTFCIDSTTASFGGATCH